jgi:hypothetical protein
MSSTTVWMTVRIGCDPSNRATIAPTRSRMSARSPLRIASLVARASASAATRTTTAMPAEARMMTMNPTVNSSVMMLASPVAATTWACDTNTPADAPSTMAAAMG